MDKMRTIEGKYQVEIPNAHHIVIGDHGSINQQYILSSQYSPLAHKLIPFTKLIEEKTQNFVGRRFVYDALEQFLTQASSGYFVIKGECGIGKTSLLAHLVQERGYVHHFNWAAMGIVRSDQFLENICARLIAKYALNRPAWLPPEAARDGAFLLALLEEVSQGLAANQRVVILVDALDEVDWHGGPRENTLHLPPHLPPGIFIVATTRYKEDLPLQSDTVRFFHLDPHSDGNRDDVIAYIRQFAQRESMKPILQKWKTTLDAFAEQLLRKSEGNFMYLRYVLPAIEADKFRNFRLEELPQGLAQYYETHWRQIRAIDENRWIDYRQPVICYLATAMEPVTIGQIAEWSDIDPRRVGEAIRDWREFLDEEVVSGSKRYHIYHASFQDFLADKDETKEINLRQTHSQVADKLLEVWKAMQAGRA